MSPLAAESHALAVPLGGPGGAAPVLMRSAVRPSTSGYKPSLFPALLITHTHHSGFIGSKNNCCLFQCRILCVSSFLLAVCFFTFIFADILITDAPIRDCVTKKHLSFFFKPDILNFYFPKKLKKKLSNIKMLAIKHWLFIKSTVIERFPFATTEILKVVGLKYL